MHNPQTVLNTIAKVNSAIAADPNALMAITGKGETIEGAYLNLIRDLVELGRDAR